MRTHTHTHILQAIAAANAALEGEALVFLVALRNLLAHSGAAKIAALRAGLHTSLQHTCLLACRALGVTEGGPAAGATATLSAGGAKATGGGIGGRVRGPRSAAGMNSQRSSVSGVGSTRPPVASSAPGTPSRKGAAGSIPPSSPRSVVTTTIAGGGGRGASAVPPLSRHPAIDKRVTVALSLLKHLAYKGPAAKQLLTRDGLVEAVRKLWKHGFGPVVAPSSTSSTTAAASEYLSTTGWGAGTTGRGMGGPTPFTSSPALHELLGLLANMVVECADARAKICGEGAPTLLQSVLGLVFEVGVVRLVVLRLFVLLHDANCLCTLCLQQ